MRNVLSRFITIVRLILKKKISIIKNVKAAGAYGESAVLLLVQALRHERPLLQRPRIFLGLSLKCNIRCAFCLTHSSLIASEEEKSTGATWQLGKGMATDNFYMDFEKFKQITDDLQYLDPAAISFSGGGETLLYPNLLEAVAYLKTNRKLKYTNIRLSTNGILLTKGLSEKLLKMGINDINISLNSTTPATYEVMHCVDGRIFNAILQNIKDLAELIKLDGKLTRVSISFVLCKYNFREIVDMIRLCDSLKVRMAKFRFIYHCKGKHERLNDFILDINDKKILKDLLLEAILEAKNGKISNNLVSLLNMLKAGNHEYFLPNRAHAYTCQIHATGKVSPYDFPCFMGDLNDESILDIWYSRKYTAFRNWVKKKALIKSPIPNIPLCFRCDYTAEEKNNKCCIVF